MVDMTRPKNAAWHEIPEMPLKAEVMATNAGRLPHHEVGVPPEDKNQYLEAQYRLLRHEGVELLRRSVQEFREDPEMVESSNTAIYTNVSVHGYFVSRIGTFCRIGFCPTRVDAQIRWKNSPRLTPGTIVALSTMEDKFQTICMVAHVAQKNLVGGLEPDLSAGEHRSTPPRIDIVWSDVNDAILDPATELVMIEARSGYWEAVRYAMLGLQKCSHFERYLINGSREKEAPKYMDDLADVVDFAAIVRGDNPDNNPVGPLPIKADVSLPSTMAAATGLDASQLNALHHVLTSELAVIQGPPGTGKTFTSISALKVLLANLDCRKHPIILAAQTNHALDQILLLCAQETKTDFIRLGCRSQNEHISSHTVYNLRQKSQRNYGDAELGSIEARRKSHAKGIKDIVSECFPDGLLKPRDLVAHEIITHAQHDSLEISDPEDPFRAWLDGAVEQSPPHRFTPSSRRWEEVEESDAHDDRRGTMDDDEKDRIVGQYFPISESWAGRVDPQMLKPALWKRTKTMLSRYQDLWDIPREYRGAVYRYIRNRFIEVKTRDFRALLKDNAQLTEARRSCRAKLDARVIREFNIPVIGCTTTGLTKYRALLELVAPRVMLIEEAAETREANITSALFPSLEQLILVGDHMQLAPHTDVSELAHHPYNLRVSLFERMINLKVGHAVLSIQRRMIPDIRRILKPFYPTLKDHESVRDKFMRPPVPGMGATPTYFFCHNWPESRTHQQSKANMEEAKMIVGFVRYLVQNGTPPSKITILSFYRGQTFVIRDMLGRDVVLNSLNPLRKYNVCTVDGYQGEENDVVILSLVRSPYNGAPFSVGFLDNQNRVVVALSRARRGFYVFGNYRNLVNASSKSRAVWKPAANAFVKKDRCHSRLPLKCKKHGNGVKVKDPQDWDSLHGGCLEKCKERLGCGHVCQLRCHPISHGRIGCRQPCNRQLRCGHGCSELCSDHCRCAIKCDYVPETAKRSKVNFVTLEKFLGTDEETCDEAISATGEGDADVDAEAGAEVDLISICGKDYIVPTWDAGIPGDADVPAGNAADGEVTSRAASPESYPSAGNPSSGCTSEASSVSVCGNGAHESDVTRASGDDIERAAQKWSKWDPQEDDHKMRQNVRGAVPGTNHKRIVLKETFRQVKVRGCKRGIVGVRQSTQVQAPSREPVGGAFKSGQAKSAGEHAVPPSTVKNILIDFSVDGLAHASTAQARNGQATKGLAAERDYGVLNGRAVSNRAVTLSGLLAMRENGDNVADPGIQGNGVEHETALDEEDTRSEVSDLLQF